LIELRPTRHKIGHFGDVCCWTDVLSAAHWSVVCVLWVFMIWRCVLYVEVIMEWYWCCRN